MIAFYWIGLESLFAAWERPEYSHGYLIPLIALYLLLSRMSQFKDGISNLAPRSRLGTATVLVGLAVGLLGNLVNIPDISTYGFILCAGGMVLVLFGTKRGLLLWVPIHLIWHSCCHCPTSSTGRCRLSCR